MQKIAFICSPYAKLDTELAIDLATQLSKEALKDGCIPLCPILNFNGVMQETDYNERIDILGKCRELLMKCDCVYVADSSYGITDGMQDEINLAQKLGKEIHYRKVSEYIVKTFICKVGE